MLRAMRERAISAASQHKGRVAGAFGGLVMLAMSLTPDALVANIKAWVQLAQLDQITAPDWRGWLAIMGFGLVTLTVWNPLVRLLRGESALPAAATPPTQEMHALKNEATAAFTASESERRAVEAQRANVVTWLVETRREMDIKGVTPDGHSQYVDFVFQIFNGSMYKIYFEQVDGSVYEHDKPLESRPRLEGQPGWWESQTTAVLRVRQFIPETLAQSIWHLANAYASPPVPVFAFGDVRVTIRSDYEGAPLRALTLGGEITMTARPR